MNDCIFCKIINDELPSKTVYEDDLIKVIMNINPSTDGHLLVLPKEHYVNIMDIKEDIVVYSLKVIKDTLYPLLKERLNCQGLTLAENNELGQEIKHFHIHLIPRYPEDGADFNYDESKLSDLDQVFDKLK
ncbi:MAG: HIT domain-containing protein [Bacilli bacterium]|nr:HIT domain-containing protein [Bacilli bacterium]